MAGSACDNTTAPDLKWQLTQLKAYVMPPGEGLTPADGIEVTSRATWSVDRPQGVVTVSNSGVVTALAPGSVTVRASYGDRDGSMSFVVR